MTAISLRGAFVLSALTVFAACCLAQPPDDLATLKPRKLKRFGKNAERLGDWYSAIDYYRRYSELKKTDAKIRFRLAEQYRAARDYHAAKDLYLQAYESDQEKYTTALFWHAVMLKMTGEYGPALELFSRFRKEYKGGKDEQYYKARVKTEIAGCELAPKILDSALELRLTHLDTSINKAHVELSPASIDRDRMIYASLRADKVVHYARGDSAEAVPVRRFYLAEKKGENWVSKGAWEGPFNADGMNTGNGAFSPDGSRFYFTRCEKNFQGKVICAIFVSQNKDGRWSEPEKLDKSINHPRYTSTQPAVGTESKRGYEVLYFVSDRPGAKGGLDIWYSIYDAKRKTYRDPRRAGNTVNTIGDEMTPWYDMETRSLYFSSDGHPGIGGLDIFRTTGEAAKWSEPENTGHPLNSQADDLYYTVSKNREEGFFASNREGGVALKNPTCCDDLYSYRWNRYIHIAVTGIIFEVDDSSRVETLEEMIDFRRKNQDHSLRFRPLGNASVALHVVDRKSGQPVYIKSVTTEPGGRYFLTLEHGRDYRLVVQKDNYFNRQIEFTTKNIETSDTLQRNAGIAPIPPEPIIIKNIYYPFDKYYLTDSAKLTIDTTIYPILVENPNIIAEISSHTDSHGTDKYNERLSQNRAESVVKYLIERGIAKERLVAKGYGETRHIAPNEHPDGSDNPEGRAKNRRTEFRVIGVIKDVSDVIYEE